MKNRTPFYVISICIMALAGLIWTFTNVGPDEEYQIALAYRFITGDKPMIHMWEPHQTSVFLVSALLVFYRVVFKTYSGVVLFLQAVGILLRASVAGILYKTLRRDFEKPLAFAIASIFFMISPKDFAIPEYSNLMTWSATLCFILLITYFRNKRSVFLILSAVSLCISVISYPSAVLIFFPVIVLLAIYSDSSKRIPSILLYTFVCIGIGGTFAGYFIYILGLKNIISNYQNMLMLEPSHNVGVVSKVLSYLKDAGIVALILSGILGISFLVSILVVKQRGKKGEEGKIQRRALLVAISSAILCVLFFLNILSVENRCAYTVIFIYMIIIGFAFIKGLPETEKRLYLCGSIISIGCFLATLTLTNLPFIVSGAYLVLAVGMSVIPIHRFAKDLYSTGLRRTIYGCFFAFLLLLFFRAVYIRTPMTGRGQICSIIDTDMSYVHDGPAKFIITNDEGAKKQQIGYEEFRQFVPTGSNIWIVDGIVDDLGYLYNDYKIATPSSIPDPKYLPGIEKYWELNPEKYPDVVIVGAFEGELSYDVRTNEWFMNWLNNEFQPDECIEGTFWNFYFKE